ncbi:helix-turn-helix domain-containing protein [Actinophytocola gossypii]|uniref:Helix-turn-helix domain-containing protein n=1 Tax=Actinophytocola gossypii TaxID=2812003 RepID=A0ABT2JJ68_9PSEU|nr:helix-turn-helix domain-containing protein [Actinophytocola gossypii]MCT2587916.1 helix-turn-helix domain-containing protein [Actinophytocola gossypii]
MEKLGPTGHRVARRLGELRRERGLTLGQLEKRLTELGRPIQLSALSKTEKGERRVDADDLVALARALSVSPNSLLLPLQITADTEVELTSAVVLQAEEAWTWALRDHPSMRRTRNSKGTAALPVHRLMLAMDVVGASTRSNVMRATLRNTIHDLLERALLMCGISEDLRDPHLDRGDGLLVLIYPADQVPKSLLVTDLLPRLAALLQEHNETASDQPLRLRVALHSGDIHFDSRGVFGEDIDIVFRLLNSGEPKARSQQSSRFLTATISEGMYRSVVRHGYDGIDANEFEPVAAGEHRGWMTSVRRPGADHVFQDRQR